MSVKQLIDNLQLAIKEEWGVNANLKINIHSHNNNYNYEEAKEISGKIALVIWVVVVTYLKKTENARGNFG